MKHGKGCKCAICQGEGIQSLFKTIDSNIRKHGFHITWVFEDQDTEEPTFSYTAGLATTYQHPEILIFGVDHQTAADLLHAVAEELRKGKRIVPGQLYGQIANMPVLFGEVETDKASSQCRLAFMAQPNAEVQVLQMVWPDPNGRFPNEQEYDQQFAKMQPILCKLLRVVQ